jgi:glycosyltransferase involved in cell wall biosynthesis
MFAIHVREVLWQQVHELKKCACYINTSKFSPVPMSLLEAMSCGMPIVSTKHQQVAKLLNESNSISSNDLDQLVDGVVNVCNNNKLYNSIGVNARNEILNKFSMESFMNNWNDIFDKAYNKRLGELNEIFYKFKNSKFKIEKTTKKKKTFLKIY